MLIEDAIQRDDVPFLTAAGALIRSFADYKNAWKAVETTAMRVDLLMRVDEAVFTPAKHAEEYANAQADRAVYVWKLIAAQLSGREGDLDPMFRTTGALEPVISQDG
jgi:hypothetical protein